MFNLDNYNKGTIASETDMNTLTKSGYYRWFAEAGYPLNLPNDRAGRGMIIVLTVYSHTLQIVYSYQGATRSRVGVNNIFSDWK